MPTLIVQRGHCYRSTGATGTTGEQAYATAVADACIRLLHGRGGWSVRSTLADENYYRGDAFVAIHCDGSTSAAARGASVGYRTAEGQVFGQAWKRAYADRGWTGGFRPDNYTTALAQYYGTGSAVSAGTRRAFIAECGFRTNPDDRALLDGQGGPERVALAIGDALGIPTEEEDMNQAQNDALSDVWRLLRTGEGYTNSNMQRQLGFVVQQVQAVGAAVAAAASGGQLDADALAARLETVTAEAAERAIVTTVLPALREVLADALGEDNTDQADQIVDRLAERLRPAA